MRIAALIGVGLMTVAASASAVETGPSGPELAAARRAGMALSGGLMASMKSVSDAGGSVRPLAFGAASMARWAEALPGLFPQGTDNGALEEATNARPEIWSDRAGFEQKAADYAAAAQRLAELARADDQAGFAEQWTVVRAACQACHDAYKAEPARH